MSRSTQSLLLLLAPLLCSCVSLPGGDTTPSRRFDLPTPEAACDVARTPIALSISELAPGLDSDRVARRNAASGEIDYLQGVRWVGPSNEVVEKALARDLECRGYTVLSGRHRRGAHDQLVCELRAFNLVQSPGDDRADVSLSCFVFGDGEQDLAIVARGGGTVERWSVSAAVAALGRAYRQALDSLLKQLSAGTAPGLHGLESREASDKP